MKNTSIYEIAKWCDGEIIKEGEQNNINSVSVDSREIKKGGLFVPLKGENADGHAFINNAFEKGACACLIDENCDIMDSSGTVIRVGNTLDSLQKIAKNYKNTFDIPVIGVTGSVGKTTTKEMIASVLSIEMDVLKTQGNHNGQIGLPLTLLEMEEHHEVVVVEMGISKFGEMERLANIAEPDIGVITNIGISHIENLKTQENIREEKLKILKNYNGKYFLNGDSPFLARLNENRLENVVYFGLNGAYQYRAEDILSIGQNTEFALITPDFKENLVIPCLGIHNVYNALAAISIAMDIGMYFDDIKTGLLNYRGVSMRQEISTINGINIIDDSYNASPDSVKSALAVLRAVKPEGRNIAVIADMLELGDNTEKIHYELGKYIALEGIDILVTVGNLSKFIHQGANDSALPIKTMHFSNNEEATECIYSLLEAGDKILLKGSRGMHVDEIVLALKKKLSNEEPQKTEEFPDSENSATN